MTLTSVSDKIYMFPYIENNSECYGVMVKWKMRMKKILHISFYLFFFYKQENYVVMIKIK